MIGAGSSGLVTLKTLLAHGLDATCFEQSQHVGGLWVHENGNERSGIYDSLHINTSTRQTQFSDFPFPGHLGDFPHHAHMAKYFEDYASHFDLHKHIRFDRSVTRCLPIEASGYELSFSSPIPKERFDAVIVANGHHFTPLWPERESYIEFEGEVLHSSTYRNPTLPHDLRGKRVVIVGVGNSAMDIACELARTGGAKFVTVSARRGAWIMPKYLRGQPIDGPAFFPHWLPGRLRRHLVTRAFRWLYGSMSDFGLPEPGHLIGEAHPTISTEFAPMVKSGDIQMKPGWLRAERDQVYFTDGSSTWADAIVFCTGYRVELPFFDADHVSAPDNSLPLFFRTFHPQYRHVFFVGLLQTIGAVMPVAEAQATAIAKHLCGGYNLPVHSAMITAIRDYERKMQRRFVPSLRHTMQVIPEEFQHALRVELKRGARRARSGAGIPFPHHGTAK